MVSSLSPRNTGHRVPLPIMAMVSGLHERLLLGSSVNWVPRLMGLLARRSSWLTDDREGFFSLV